MNSGITSSFDASVRAQDDFFEHVNGEWIKNTEIPADRARYGAFDRLREASEAAMRELIEKAAAADAEPGTEQAKVGDLYRSFMDTDRIEGLGSQPLSDDLAAIAAVHDVPGLIEQFGRLARQDVWGPIAIYVSADAGNPEENIAYLEQYGLGLPDESYYREDQYQPIREKYIAHIEKLLNLAGHEASAKHAQGIFDVEHLIAASHWDNVASRDAVRTYNKSSSADLQQLAPNVDWPVFLAALEAPDGSFDAVVVRQPSFLTGLSAALVDLPIEQWKDYLSWRLISSRAPHLTDAIVQESFDFHGRTLSGVPELKERWKRGVGLVEEALGEAAGQLYVAAHFPPRAKERMTELVANLIEAYRRDFETLPWMGEQTRAQALEKLGKFTPKIGYPDKWRDYSSLTIDADDLIGNVRRAAEFEIHRQLDKVGKPIDRTEWLMTPQTVNAYYHPVMNEIVFPAAILQPPFFDVDADDAVNYGGIGAVIGHEIGHGFDDQGSRYDGNGALRDWWTEQDRSRFDSLAKKLIDQFNEQSPADAPDVKVNGALTVGENIGDLGGLTIGYKAYEISQETNPAIELYGFTPAQRFFIGWAQVWCGKAREAEAKRLIAIDPHSPANCRCNVARNLVEFHEAFGVTEGDGMYLPEEQRVRIF
ncbi:M13 family metallopeptidase [Branchiibius hedensis]|nr:M13-type metalloendopeptidase [Branchiibius hedensis]